MTVTVPVQMITLDQLIQKPENIMDTSIAPDLNDTVLYRSGAAARLSGVPVETLRVWERRYAIVRPQVSPSGRKLYSAENIQRLRLIKQLVAMGNSIGSVASLPMQTLQQMLADSAPLVMAPRAQVPGHRALRVALVGEAQASGRGRGLNVVAVCEDITQAAIALQGISVDAVIIEMSSLMQAEPKRITAIRDAAAAPVAIVLYRYGPAPVMRHLREAGHVVAHAALDAVEFDELCRSAMVAPERPVGDEPPAPRFDTAALSALSATRNSIYCECPRHLAELVRAVQGFERYSAECAVRSPVDAALHGRLQHSAGRARALLEDALVELALAEGLPLPQAAKAA